MACPTPECSAIRSWTRDHGAEHAFSALDGWDRCRVGGACGQEVKEFWCLDDEPTACTTKGSRSVTSSAPFSGPEKLSSNPVNASASFPATTKRTRDEDDYHEPNPTPKLPRLAVKTSCADLKEDSDLGVMHTPKCFEKASASDELFTSISPAAKTARSLPDRKSSVDIFTQRNVRQWNSFLPTSGIPYGSPVAISPSSSGGEISGKGGKVETATSHDENKENIDQQQHSKTKPDTPDSSVNLADEVVKHVVGSLETVDPRRRRSRILSGNPKSPQEPVQDQTSGQVADPNHRKDTPDAAIPRALSLNDLRELLRKVEEEEYKLIGDELVQVQRLYRRHGKKGHQRTFSSEELQALVDEMKNNPGNLCRPSSSPPPPPPPPPLLSPEDEARMQDEHIYPDKDESQVVLQVQALCNAEIDTPLAAPLKDDTITHSVEHTSDAHENKALQSTISMPDNEVLDSPPSPVSSRSTPERTSPTSRSTSCDTIVAEQPVPSLSKAGEGLPDWVRDDEDVPGMYWNSFGLPRFKPDYLRKFGVKID